MDTLIRETSSGTQQIWYSENYLKEHIRTAYEAGMAEAVGIQFHAVTPMTDIQMDELMHKFKSMVKEEYLTRFGKVTRFVNGINGDLLP